MATHNGRKPLLQKAPTTEKPAEAQASSTSFDGYQSLVDFCTANWCSMKTPMLQMAVKNFLKALDSNWGQCQKA